MRFTRTRKGLQGNPSAGEAQVLRRCALDLLELLGEREAPDQDPLAAMVGMPTGDPQVPEDPALARLLPDAYGDDDPEANREFRRYTDADLRARKRADAEVVARMLPEGGGKVLLDRDEADSWLGFLNDLRLVLGTRLEVTEDLDEDALAADDARLPALQLYAWLGWLQESLISCLEPRR